ncbi:MAG TPA: transketolase [Deinococcales bacterium]|nr:transketolase [Deinococcales bacterium]
MNAADTLTVNALRVLALEAVEKAKEGHPGAPVGLAPAAYALFSRLRFNPRDPHWANRDRFVLSAGHASMLLYGALYLTGYDVTLDDLQHFRTLNSRTPGHPEYGHTPGVETTTGPLGQGFANAVGMAIAEAHLAERFNRPGHTVVDYRTYAICGDGDLMEGISHEAGSLAGHLGLGKLTLLYDDNRVSLDGPTSWSFTEDVTRRFEAYGWQVLNVPDGDHNLDGLHAALDEATADTGRPTLIRVHTTIGLGLPKQGTSAVHGKAPTAEEVAAAKRAFGWPEDLPAFATPESALNAWRRLGERGPDLQAQWQETLEGYRREEPQLAAELESIWQGSLPGGWDGSLPYLEAGSKPVATRVSSNQAIQVLAAKVPALIGGSADLASSNNTEIKASPAMEPGAMAARNINFGVREHAMVGIANGLALSGLRPFVGTFLIFSDYAKNGIRLASLMKQPVMFVFTHDSVGVGTDGPTHQPVEQLAGLRAIPGLRLFRPADHNEAVTAWKLALERKDGPTVLALTRQNVPVLASNPEGVARGGYVIRDAADPKVILIATGSEVHLALAAAEELAKQDLPARVVSLPSWDLFSAQPSQYRDQVLPPALRARVGIEAGASLGWERWVGLDGRIVAIDRFGASAPGDEVMELVGLTVEHVVAEALDLLGRPARAVGEGTPQVQPTPKGEANT